MMRRYLGRAVTVAALVMAVTGAMAAGAAGAAHAADKREIAGREAFAAGKYQEALDIFVKLYAEKLHPNYLRNIGRCYQNLNDPDKAISSFREYLRKAKGVNAEERQEVESYIKEMEDLKRQRDTAVTTPPPPPPGGGDQGGGAAGAGAGGAAGGGTTLVVLPPPPPPGGGGGPGVDISAGGGSGGTPPDSSSPVYKRWWFWALVVGVVAAGVGTAAALGAFNKTEDAPCTGMCFP